VAPHRFSCGAGNPASIPSRIFDSWRPVMLDLIMFVIAAGLFAATLGYAYACERL
jgi:hypothetical protein